MNQRIQKQNIREKYWRYSLYVILLGLGTVIFVELIPFLGGLLGALTIYVLLRGQMRALTIRHKLRRSLAASLLIGEAIVCFLIPLSLLVWLLVAKLQDVTLDPSTVIQPIRNLAELIRERIGYNLLDGDNIAKLVELLPRAGQWVLQSIGSFAVNVVVLLFVLLSFMTQNVLSTYQNKVLLTVGINIILAVSLNVSTGYLGQLPLGHAGFMAVGAYTCALFTKYSPLPSGVAFVIGLALGAVMAGIFGVLIGIPALRLTGDYLAILTLGFGEIIRITLNNIDDVLGFKLFYGAKGLKNIPKYSNYWNVFLCVVITCFAIHAMMKSRHGRAVLAIRDNEIAAESCGIQTTYYKVMAFAFSAAFAGLAGGLYACYLGVLDPSTFGFMKSIEILVMVVLGGMGSMLGSILSATVLTILPEATRSFESYRMVVYSLVLILMMIFRPGGLLGSYDFSMSRIVEKIMNGELFRKKAKEGADHE